MEITGDAFPNDFPAHVRGLEWETVFGRLEIGCVSPVSTSFAEYTSIRNDSSY